MFCSQCGTQMSEADRFCVKCGKSITAFPASLVTQKISSSEPEVSPPCSFGVPETRWWLPFKGKVSFPYGYEWLEHRNTLIVYRNHLVLVEGDEKRSAALDLVQTMGFVGAGRGVKNSCLNKKFDISPEHAERLFENRLLVWCNKSDALIWRYHEKSRMFSKSTSEQIYCQFSSKAGILHTCGVLWCTAEQKGHAKGYIEGLGCRIVDVGHNLPEKKVPDAMIASRMGLQSGGNLS